MGRAGLALHRPARSPLTVAACWGKPTSFDRSRDTPSANSTLITGLWQLAEHQRAELAKRAADLHNALEEARLAREAAKAAEEQRLVAVKLAEGAVRSRELLSLTQTLQEQLKRVECYEGAIDGDWRAKTQQALANFSKFSKLALASDQPTEAALQLVTSKTSKVCIPTCGLPGERLINGKCVTPTEASGKAQKAEVKSQPSTNDNNSLKWGRPWCNESAKNMQTVWCSKWR
jgi:hypothetical protein